MVWRWHTYRRQDFGGEERLVERNVWDSGPSTCVSLSERFVQSFRILNAHKAQVWLLMILDGGAEAVEPDCHTEPHGR